MTTIKVDSKSRDDLARVASDHFDGATLNQALDRLIREHRLQRVRDQHDRLRADPEELASYRTEVAEWERAGWKDLSARLMRDEE